MILLYFLHPRFAFQGGDGVEGPPGRQGFQVRFPLQTFV